MIQGTVKWRSNKISVSYEIISTLMPNSELIPICKKPHILVIRSALSHYSLHHMPSKANRSKFGMRLLYWRLFFLEGWNEFTPGMPVSFYMTPVLCVHLILPEVFTHLYWTVLIIQRLARAGFATEICRYLYRRSRRHLGWGVYMWCFVHWCGFRYAMHDAWGGLYVA